MVKRKGSITHRKDGRYMGRCTVTLSNGTKKVQTVYGRTREETDKKLRTAIVEADRGKVVTRDGQTLEEFVEYWLENIAPFKLKETTIYRYKITLRIHILPPLGKTRLLSLETIVIQQRVNQKYKETMSAKLCRDFKNVLSSVMESALKLKKFIIIRSTV